MVEEKVIQLTENEEEDVKKMMVAHREECPKHNISDESLTVLMRQLRGHLLAFHNHHTCSVQ
jgi:hypothetical protein